MQNNLEEIVNYYDLCEVDYRRYWNLDQSMAMHAGYWDETTSTLEEALERENAILAREAQIGPTDRVLDAGCGVGGSSIYLARTIGCEVVGITVSAHQVETARLNALKCGVAGKVTFQEKDYCHTDFPDASFDVIWGIESVCHAKDKGLFAREAFRLLKPGGRLIMADGFSNGERKLSAAENLRMGKWLKGWGVDQLESVDGFFKAFKEAGFSTISYRDITQHVVPSSKRLFLISFPATLLSKLGEWFGLRKRIQTDNIRAAYHQYTTLREGLWEYGFFCVYKLGKDERII